MSNGPGKRSPTGPFRLVDVDAEDDRMSGAVPSGTRYEEPLPLTTEWQREVVSALHGLQEGQEKLFKGQAELTVAFGQLVPRVRKLEAAARWKVWAMRIAKAAIPLVAAALGRYAPELAKLLPDLVDAFANSL